MLKSYMGDKIKRLRLSAGFTQAELAKKIGVSRPTVSSWEVNRTDPSMQDVQAMAAAMDCNVNDIIGDYREQLIRDHDMQVMLSLAEKLSRDDIKMIIYQMEYLVDRNRKEDNRG